MTDYLGASSKSKKGLTFNSTADDVLGVVEILSLVTDPAAHKKRLDELQNAATEADRKIAAAREASEKRRTAESMFAEAAKILAERKTAAAKLDARAGDLDRREKDLVAREGKLSQQIEDHEAKTGRAAQELADREKAVSALEKSCAQQLQKIAEDCARIEKLKAEVKEFHAKFQTGRP